MRKFVLFVVILVGLIILLKDFIKSGQFDKFLDAHPNPRINTRVEYYWGIGLVLINRYHSAEYRFLRIIKNYPKTKYARYAWLELIEVYDSSNQIKMLSDTIKMFLEIYPDDPTAEKLKRRLFVITNGI